MFEILKLVDNQSQNQNNLVQHQQAANPISPQTKTPLAIKLITIYLLLFPILSIGGLIIGFLFLRGFADPVGIILLPFLIIYFAVAIFGAWELFRLKKIGWIIAVLLISLFILRDLWLVIGEIMAGFSNIYQDSRKYEVLVLATRDFFSIGLSAGIIFFLFKYRNLYFRQQN